MACFVHVWMAFGILFLPGNVALAKRGLPYRVQEKNQQELETQQPETKNRAPAQDNKKTVLQDTKRGSKMNNANATGSGAEVPPNESSDLFSPEAFQTLWKERVEAIASNDNQKAKELLKQLVEKKKQSAWSNLLAYARVLVHEATSRNTQKGQAQELLDAAAILAPDDAVVQAARARMFWNHGKRTDASAAAYKALMFSLTRPPFSWSTLVHLALAFMTAMLLATLLFGIAMLLKYGKALAHDVWHLLLRTTSKLQAWLVLGLVVLTPVVLGLGPLWILLWWLLPTALYLKTSERVVSLILLAYLGTLPWTLPWVLSFLSYPTSRTHLAYLAAQDVSADDLAQMLGKKEDIQQEEYMAMGQRALMSGDLQQASIQFSKAQKVGESDPFLLTTLGNIEFRLGRIQSAVDFYLEAARKDPKYAVAHYNLSKAYHALTRTSDANDAFQRALSLGSQRVKQMKMLAQRPGALGVVDPPVPVSLWQTGYKGPTEHAIAQQGAGQVMAALFGNEMVTSTQFSLIVGVIWCAFFLCFVFGFRLAPSLVCNRCGASACKRCHPELLGQRVCDACYKAFVAKHAGDAKDKVVQEHKSKQHVARKKWLQRILSLFLPGTDLFFGDAAVLGFCIFVLYAVSGICVGIGLDALPNPTGFVQPMNTLLSALFVLCALLCIGTSAFLAWRKK